MKTYTVTINGIDHQMNLDKDDASRYKKAGLIREGEKATPKASETSEGASVPGEGSEPKEDPKEASGEPKEAEKVEKVEKVEAKQARPANKAATASAKG